MLFKKGLARKNLMFKHQIEIYYYSKVWVSMIKKKKEKEIITFI